MVSADRVASDLPPTLTVLLAAGIVARQSPVVLREAWSGMFPEDDFTRALRLYGGTGPESGALTELAIRYSYVAPEPGLLQVLQDLAPLVEVGAGTGYWAGRLRELGTDIIAFDQAPPDHLDANRYHPGAATWTEVLEGDQGVLSDHPERTLFVCWPPLFSSLGDCLTFYAGDNIAWIGDSGQRTAVPAGLEESFQLEAVYPVRALEPWPGSEPRLGIWHRRNRDSGAEALLR
jgi:hypothetical protein